MKKNYCLIQQNDKIKGKQRGINKLLNANIQYSWEIQYLDRVNIYTMDATGNQIAELEKKITAMEADNLQQFQKQILASLYQLRSALIQDIKNLGASPAGNDDEKDKKIAELEAENKRLNYRVLHLCQNLRKKLE